MRGVGLSGLNRAVNTWSERGRGGEGNSRMGATEKDDALECQAEIQTAPDP